MLNLSNNYTQFSIREQVAISNREVGDYLFL